MSDKDDEQFEEEHEPAHEEAREEEEIEEAPRRSRRGGLAKFTFWIILLVIIIVVIFWLVSWYRNSSNNAQQVQAAADQFQAVKSHLNQIDQHNRDVQAQLAALQSATEQQESDIAFAKASSARLEEELTGKQMGWLLNEALYLVRLANYNLMYQHDSNTAIALLEDADQALFATGYPDVNPVRKMIAENITSLQAIPKIDMTGIFLRLNALDNQISKLPLLAENPAPQKLSEAQKTHEKNDDWKTSLKKNVHSLGKLIIIQRRDKPIEPLITPEQQTLLTLYLSNLFTNAQWAVLHHNNSIFQTSLSQIKSVVSTYYSTTSDATLQLLSSIDSLTKNNLSPALPDLSVTVKALTELSDQMAPPTKKVSSNKASPST